MQNLGPGKDGDLFHNHYQPSKGKEEQKIQTNLATPPQDGVNPGSLYGSSYGSPLSGAPSANEPFLKVQVGNEGKGPKYYRREDEELKIKLCEMLKNDRFLDASKIEVCIQEGAVTLKGSVLDSESKNYVTDLISHVDEVKVLANQLEVCTA